MRLCHRVRIYSALEKRRTTPRRRVKVRCVSALPGFVGWKWWSPSCGCCPARCSVQCAAHPGPPPPPLFLSFALEWIYPSSGAEPTSATGRLDSHLKVKTGPGRPSPLLPFFLQALLLRSSNLSSGKPARWQQPGDARAPRSWSASCPPRRATCSRSPRSPLSGPASPTDIVVGYYGLRAVGRRSTMSFAYVSRETRRAISPGAHTEVGAYPRQLRTNRASWHYSTRTYL